MYLSHNGKIETKEFKRGLTLGPQPRFDAAVASATVPVAPVAAQLAVQPADITCGQSADLNWKSANAVDTSITNLGKVSTDGNRSVEPMNTTTYEITAKGPGGTITKTVTVDVNTQPEATLALNQPEVRYHKIGDKVVQDDSATLNWSASNASNVTIDPLGSEAASGSQTIKAAPKQTSTGPINEDVTYRLTSSNVCGGKTIKTATLHITGSIDPPPSITLASLFYPTNYPTRRHAKVGLVASEEAVLRKAAEQFKNYDQYEKASLVVVGHADVRGPEKYNMVLSDRRANLVKNYLVSLGIAADKIQTRAEGKKQELNETQVEMLQSKDPQKPEKWMAHRTKDTWLAYNRRVDVVLEPTGEPSMDEYPNDVSDARILWQRPEPSLKKVEIAAKSPNSTGSLHAGLTQN